MRGFPARCREKVEVKGRPQKKKETEGVELKVVEKETGPPPQADREYQRIVRRGI